MGDLFAKNIYGAIFNCNVLELPWKNNQIDLSCIIPGTYVGVWTFMADRGEWHYMLQAVPGRTGIFQHEGDFWYNSLGCQLLGVKPSDINGDGQIDVTSSKPTLAAYEAFFGQRPILVHVMGIQN